MSTPPEAAFPLGAPPAGSLFAGRYRIESLLGEGGMGYVLGARDESTAARERVALKLLLPEHSMNRTTVARFLREMRASHRILSEHVARVLHAGDDGGTLYIVMEYLEGSDLAALLEREGSFTVPRAVDTILQACEALAEAHAAGTIHRDLKPANLFVTRSADGRECVKVLDFGISRIIEPANVALTTTTAAAGTPLYMSPEQLRSMRDVDARTDIWAIGVVMFELLAARPPFLANSVAEIGAQVLTGSAPDVRSFARNIPERMAVAIARCLRREVDERFPSLSELADAIAPFGTSAAAESRARIVRTLAGVTRPRAVEPPPVPPLPSDPVIGPLALAQTMPDAQRTTGPQWRDSAGSLPSPSPRRRWLVGLGGIVFGAMAFVAVFTRGSSGPRSTTDAPTATAAIRAPTPADVVLPVDAGVVTAIPSAEAAPPDAGTRTRTDAATQAVASATRRVDPPRTRKPQSPKPSPQSSEKPTAGDFSTTRHN